MTTLKPDDFKNANLSHFGTAGKRLYEGACGANAFDKVQQCIKGEDCKLKCSTFYEHNSFSRPLSKPPTNDSTDTSNNTMIQFPSDNSTNSTNSTTSPTDITSVIRSQIKELQFALSFEIILLVGLIVLVIAAWGVLSWWVAMIGITTALILLILAIVDGLRLSLTQKAASMFL